MNKQPNILVFDSGIGGISVYQEVQAKIPQAHYIYLFDNAAFPYGDKSNEFLINRVVKVINQAVSLFDVDLIVVACNTASTICLQELRSVFTIPVVGVVPAIKPATLISKNKHIGLLATKATVQREYTQNLIQQFAQGYKVELLGLSELALIAEEKLQGTPVNIPQLRELLSAWLNLAVIPDTIVLGCTHYPFIKDELQQIFPAAKFVDSGYAIATRVFNLLKEKFELDVLPNKTITTKNNILSTAISDKTFNLIKRLNSYGLDEYQLLNVKDD
ncbi:glutamate racemase [Orbaceae bacterium ac157xtp]